MTQQKFPLTPRAKRKRSQSLQMDCVYVCVLGHAFSTQPDSWQLCLSLPFLLAQSLMEARGKHTHGSFLSMCPTCVCAWPSTSKFPETRGNFAKSSFPKASHTPAFPPRLLGWSIVFPNHSSLPQVHWPLNVSDKLSLGSCLNPGNVLGEVRQALWDSSSRSRQTGQNKSTVA